jgi:hypothetical protein
MAFDQRPFAASVDSADGWGFYTRNAQGIEFKSRKPKNPH